MSLSICELCGGHIPLGPDASNKCEKCGAHVFAGLPRSTTNDNARIVREALIECGKQLNCSMTDDLLALTALETELATAKADLERAREEEARLLLKVRDAIIQGDTDEAYHLIYMFASFIAPNPHQPWEGLESRAALAPEQKGE